MKRTRLLQISSSALRAIGKILADSCPWILITIGFDPQFLPNLTSQFDPQEYNANISDPEFADDTAGPTEVVPLSRAEQKNWAELVRRLQ